MDGRDEVAEGVSSAELQIPGLDIVTDHFYPINTNKMMGNSRIVADSGIVYTVGEFGWNSNNLTEFLLAIESGPVTGDLFWSLFPHADVYGYEQHADGFTLHWPGDTADMRMRAQLLRNHAFRMRGRSVPPPYSIPLVPVITSAVNHVLEWRGATYADTYSVQRSLKGIPAAMQCYPSLFLIVPTNRIWPVDTRLLHVCNRQ